MDHPAKYGVEGRRVLVTGGNRGLGLAIAEALAACGARVVISGRDAEIIEQVCADLGAMGHAVSGIAGDLRTDCETIVAKSVERLGGLDVVVHSAGIRNRRPTHELDGSAFSDMLDVNLTAGYVLARAALPHLKRSDAGRLIFLSSIAANIARSGDPAYTAAKGGISALTRSLAVELGSDTLTVNAIAPGMFATEVNRYLVEDEAVKGVVDIRVPLKRWGRPDELASAALFLAMPASSYVNGVVLTVDGGLSAQM
ncbi:SDR family oxidoreductase [Corticibacterium sp. UT-5YL-CI-8]|nr:SDR family oxidoreductase [Tianweitania sp. UT-5YL-CI-8]